MLFIDFKTIYAKGIPMQIKIEETTNARIYIPKMAKAIPIPINTNASKSVLCNILLVIEYATILFFSQRIV